MTGHYREECEHGTPGGQCRCPSKDKSVRRIPCPDKCPQVQACARCGARVDLRLCAGCV